MIKLRIAVIFVMAISITASAQRESEYRRVHSEGFYLNFGVANGPDFSDFFNYTNDFYQTRFQNPSESIDRFDNGFNIGLGYLVRLYPNFALDVGFSIYKLKSRGRIDNQNPGFPEAFVNHELEYQVGIFSATVPVLLDFDPRQPVVGRDIFRHGSGPARFRPASAGRALRRNRNLHLFNEAGRFQKRRI